MPRKFVPLLPAKGKGQGTTNATTPTVPTVPTVTVPTVTSTNG